MTQPLAKKDIVLVIKCFNKPMPVKALRETHHFSEITLFGLSTSIKSFICLQAALHSASLQTFLPFIPQTYFHCGMPQNSAFQLQQLPTFHKH